MPLVKNDIFYIYEYRPDIGETYYYIDSTGRVKSRANNDTVSDRARLKINNCYSNEVYAEYTASHMVSLLETEQRVRYNEYYSDDAIYNGIGHISFDLEYLVRSKQDNNA